MTDPAAPTPSGRLVGDIAVLGHPLVRELLEARLIGVLATLDADDTVHAVPLWFASRDGAIVFATNGRSRKVRNLQRDSRATLVLHDSRPGFEVCGTSIRGRAEIVGMPDAAPLVESVHRRYVSEAGLALRSSTEFLASDDVALVLRPEWATIWDERANAATAALRATGGALALVPTSSRPL